MLGLDPSFPLKFMVYFLIVCAVGGTSSITGPLVAALVLGIADVMGKYYVPKLGGFIVYVLMIAILLWRPQGLFTRGAKVMSAGRKAAAGAVARWRPGRWPCGCGDLGHAVGQHAALINEIAILALFALSLDLILGYAGIVSLGHAAFFGVGAYGGAVCQARDARPAGGPAGGAGRAPCWALLTSPMIVRGTDLTRLMVTLGVAWCCWNWPTSSTASPAVPTGCRVS
jgi:ABC-type branched-subunit amino acid transport system permease subunit